MPIAVNLDQNVSWTSCWLRKRTSPKSSCLREQPVINNLMSTPNRLLQRLDAERSLEHTMAPLGNDGIVPRLLHDLFCETSGAKLRW